MNYKHSDVTCLQARVRLCSGLIRSDLCRSDDYVSICAVVKLASISRIV